MFWHPVQQTLALLKLQKQLGETPRATDCAYSPCKWVLAETLG